MTKAIEMQPGMAVSFTHEQCEVKYMDNWLDRHSMLVDTENIDEAWLAVDCHSEEGSRVPYNACPIKAYNPSAKYLFVDMDGTLAEFRKGTPVPEIYRQGYFEGLAPQPATAALHETMLTVPDNRNVFILSSYLSDSDYALSEKWNWVHEHLGMVWDFQIILVPCGTSKAGAIEERFGVDRLNENFTLVDDLSTNLHDWVTHGGRGVKYMNGINGTHGSWKGERVSADDMDGMIRTFCDAVDARR